MDLDLADLQLCRQAVICLLVEPVWLLWFGLHDNVVPFAQPPAASEVGGSQLMQPYHDIHAQAAQQRQHEPTAVITIRQQDVSRL